MQSQLFVPEFEPMRALSWKQPYASLMLHGKIETRKWSTSYRGLVLICASQQPYLEHDLFGIAGEAGTQRIFNFLNSNGIQEPKGVAIAVGRLVDCRPMTPSDEDACYVKYKEPWYETTLRKDGTPKRTLKRLYCHVYQDVRPIEQFEWSGAQGWREVEREIIESIKYKVPA